MRDRTLLVGSLTVIMAASGFGLLGPVARLAYDAGLGPISFVAWRAAFGALVVAAYVAWRARRGRPIVPPWRLPRSQGATLAVGALMGLLLNVAMFIAFDRITVALALLGFYMYPAMVAVVAAARGHERLDATRIGALAISLGGMVLVVAGGLDASTGIRLDLLGVALALFAAVCQTVFVTISRAGFPAVPTEQAMGWILAGSVLGALALIAVTGDATGITQPLRSPAALSLTAIGGILAAGIPSVLFLRGIRTIGGTRTGILMLFEPVVGVILAAALLDEQLRPVQALGGLAILGAAVIVQRSSSTAVVAGEPPAGIAADAERS